MMSDQDQSVFNQEAGDKPVSTSPALTDLVGEGKKYATEQEALASVPNAQVHISNVETENADLRRQVEELSTNSTSLETVLEAIQQRTTPAETSQTSESVDAGSLQQMVEQVVDNRSVQSREQANIVAADRLAQEAFGEDAQATVRAKAVELGVTVDFLMNTAKASPGAFAKMVGAVAPAAEVVVPPTGATTVSTVNSDSLLTGNSVKDFAYYRKMEKEDKRQYRTVAVQQEMMRSRSELGNRFFKT